MGQRKKKIPTITIQLSENFFKMFEKERLNLCKSLGLKNMTKNDFSEYLAVSGTKFKYPKIKNGVKNNTKKRRL